MNYRTFVFKADQNLDLCMDYCRQHTAVLAEYGCGGFKINKETWMDNPDVYVIAACNEAGEMVSGIRLHLSSDKSLLPVTSVVDGVSSIIDLMGEDGKVTAEICGFWIAKSVRGRGFDTIFSQAATALAYSFGATSLFTLASVYTNKMYQLSGFVTVTPDNRNDESQRPASDFASMVMLVPDLETLEFAGTTQKAKMLSLRENPVQTLKEGDITMEYQLDLGINRAPASTHRFAVAA